MPLTAETEHYLSDARRLEFLVDAVSDYAIYMLDPAGFIVTWNSGAERIKGYGSIEILGQHFSKFFTDEDRAKRLPEKILEEARAAGRYEAEGWRVRKDRRRFWANAIVQPVPDEQGVIIGFAKITRDITERLEAQNVIKESERRFRLLVDGVVDYAIVLLDPGGVVTNWNAGAQRLQGYAAAEILGQHFSKFYAAEDRAVGLPGRMLETAAREGRYETEGWRLRKDGSRFWASIVVDAIKDDAGTLLGFAKVTRDITERRAALDALRESERQFRLLVAGVTDYALFMLDPNGIVTSWNAGAHRIKGYTAEEIIGHHFSRFYTERDRAAGVPTRALYTAVREGRFEAEGWRLRKDGTMFWANVVIDPIKGEHDELIGFAKVTRDITERREAQLALQEAEKQRAHAQKMDALGQLTGGVAHDFNNLLMVIGGHLQAIQKAAAGDPKIGRAADAISLAVERGGALTRQLLTFARRQTIHPVAIEISEQIEAIRDMLASSLGGSVKLVTTIGSDIWSIKVDKNEFELALVNLAINARDAMPEGGTVSIVAENVHLKCDDTKARINGDFVAIRLNDTGCGIAPDVLPNVFDPFFTTKGPEKGTGLGLSQVHGFVHQSGGTVAVESDLGRGTCITLFLPRASGDKAMGRQDKPNTDSTVGGKVLLVEDNPDVMNATLGMLEQLGYEVTALSDATAALRVLEQDNFDLVVSDIVMPGMDGTALAHAIRSRKPGLPVLLMTGYGQGVETPDPGRVVLRKPFQLSDLGRVTTRLIAEAKQSPTSNLVRLSDARRAVPSKLEEK